MKCPRCKFEIDPDSTECEICGKTFSPKLNVEKCKDCGGMVSKNAESCPHCGAVRSKKTITSKKKLTPWQAIRGLIVLFIIIFSVFFMLFNINSSKKSYTSKQKVDKEQQRIEKEKAKKYELCKKSLQCWGDKHSFQATIASEKIIERFAKYDFKWTDGFLGSKIKRFKWLNKRKLTLIYFGDEIQFQNGLGLWVRHHYRIDYDPINKKVLNVTVNKGKLPEY